MGVGAPKSNEVTPAPLRKPGGLNEKQKGVVMSSASSIFVVALQTSNLWLGVACVGLLMVGSCLMAQSLTPTRSP